MPDPFPGMRFPGVVAGVGGGIPDRAGHPPTDDARLGLLRVRQPPDPTRRPEPVRPPEPDPPTARTRPVPAHPTEERQLRMRAVQLLTDGGLRQVDIAKLLHVSQPTVSLDLRDPTGPVDGREPSG